MKKTPHGPDWLVGVGRAAVRDDAMEKTPHGPLAIGVDRAARRG